MNELDTNNRDRLASVVKSLAGVLPFAGTMVGEVIDSVIPGLRIERVVTFLKAIDERVGEIDEQLTNFHNNLKSEEGIDIFEEGIIQSSRAVSEDRKLRLASLIANSLTAEQLKYSEVRKLLNIYSELTDPEVIWLIYYSLNPFTSQGHQIEWLNKHPEILKPISRQVSAPQEQHERAAIQDSYKGTLFRLGLTTEKNRSIILSTLGRLLVRYIND